MLTRRSFLAGAALALGSAGAEAQTSYWGRRLPEPTDYIFGYGSLMSTSSRESTGRAGMHALPARLSPEFGLVRSWCARADRLGFTALGLRRLAPGEAGWSINGVVFPVEPALLPRFDRRESGYDRVAVPRALIEGVSWEALPEAGTIWAYVPRKRPGGDDAPVLPDLEHPVIQSYLDLCLQGALEFSPNFAREVIATTADWSSFWLNDRPVARRPWAMNPDAGTIDDLLAATAPAADRFADRLFPEQYAVRMMREGAKAPQ